jgi:hypothetical protein
VACGSGPSHASDAPGATGAVSPQTRSINRCPRTLADAAIGGQQVLIRLRIRRFLCHHPACPAHTFAEQIPGLTTPHARCGLLACRLLEAIGLALAATLALPASRRTAH